MELNLGAMHHAHFQAAGPGGGATPGGVGAAPGGGCSPILAKDAEAIAQRLVHAFPWNRTGQVMGCWVHGGRGPFWGGGAHFWGEGPIFGGRGLAYL